MPYGGYILIDRGVEQLVARRAHNPKVEGSNPSPATRESRNAGLLLFVSMYLCGVGKETDTLDGSLELTGRGSARLEHLPWEQGVAGSNPAVPTNLETPKFAGDELTQLFDLIITAGTYILASSC